MEHPDSLLLPDDLAAWETAVTNGLCCTGTIGCMAKARQPGLFPAGAPVLREFPTKARFWISDRLAERILRDFGER